VTIDPDRGPPLLPNTAPALPSSADTDGERVGLLAGRHVLAGVPRLLLRMPRGVIGPRWSRRERAASPAKPVCPSASRHDSERAGAPPLVI